MKTVNNVTLYCCEFCNKRLIRKHAMANHELHCSRNPANISICSGCVFLKENTEEIEIGDNYFNEPVMRTVNTFFCEKKNVKLFPHKAVRLGLPEKYPHQFEGQEKMPTKCELWNYTKD